MDQLIKELKTVLNKELESISSGLSRVMNKQESINVRLEKLKDNIENINSNNRCMFTILIIMICLCTLLFIDALYIHMIHR